MRLSAFLGLSILLSSLCASAQDRFEIQVYDSEVAQAGQLGLELHTNYVFKGSRSTSPEGELATEHVLRATLEPHIGLFGWGELGAYLQSALRPGGAFDYAGVKLRFKARWPEKFFDDRLGLALNVEVIDLRVGPFYGSVNPIISIDLRGPAAGHPQFQPAAKLAVFVRPDLSVGSEYYAAFGPLDALLAAGEQNHYLYGVVDFTSAYVDFNVGLGRGFGGAEPWVAKSIFSFHPQP
jgi:hypothetical protein